MVKLKGHRTPDGICISEGSFEHLLNCLDNQKFIHDVNADATELSTAEVKSIQAENQACIDDFGHQCRKLLHNR